MFSSSKIKLFWCFGLLLLLNGAKGNNTVESYTNEMLRRIEQQLTDFKLKHDETINRIEEFKRIAFQKFQDEGCYNVTVEHFGYKNDSDPFGNLNLGQIKTSLSNLLEMRNMFGGIGGTDSKANQSCECDATQQTKLNTEMQTNIIQQLNKSSTELNQVLINKITELNNASTDKNIQTTSLLKTTVQNQINQIIATTQESSNKTNQLLIASNAFKTNLDNQVQAYSTSQHEMALRLQAEIIKNDQQFQQLLKSTQSLLKELKTEVENHIEKQERANPLTSCSDVIARGYGFGLYQILILDEFAYVYCDESGKMMIQHQIEGPKDFFNRTWSAFKEGFGHPSSQYWMGLQKLHKLTTARHYELHILMVDFDNVTTSAKFDDFQIGNEKEKYKILKITKLTDGAYLSGHLNNNFSTFDNINTNMTYCPKEFMSGWWYNECYYSNLNLPTRRNVDEHISYVLHWNKKFLKEVSMFIKSK